MKNALDGGTGTVFRSVNPSAAQHLEELSSCALAARGGKWGRKPLPGKPLQQGRIWRSRPSNENSEKVLYFPSKVLAGATKFQLSRQKANWARGRPVSETNASSSFVGGTNPTAHFVPEQWQLPVLLDDGLLNRVYGTRSARGGKMAAPTRRGKRAVGTLSVACLLAPV